MVSNSIRLWCSACLIRPRALPPLFARLENVERWPDGLCWLPATRITWLVLTFVTSQRLFWEALSGRELQLQCPHQEENSLLLSDPLQQVLLLWQNHFYKFLIRRSSCNDGKYLDCHSKYWNLKKKFINLNYKGLTSLYSEHPNINLSWWSTFGPVLIFKNYEVRARKCPLQWRRQ